MADAISWRLFPPDLQPADMQTMASCWQVCELLTDQESRGMSCLGVVGQKDMGVSC